ncbi:hypothetical protein CIPAW_03G119200 [Carya illinoinensis]|uniref:Uncharacterized protein n=1 Tax=Carya illinoinensis TaxID=32201 RepID=A0A8T1QZT6_CARIL|nr:hypothetical protein CIPAW_03G119200 [Carya illinoinensis]
MPYVYNPSCCYRHMIASCLHCKITFSNTIRSASPFREIGGTQTLKKLKTDRKSTVNMSDGGNKDSGPKKGLHPSPSFGNQPPSRGKIKAGIFKNSGGSKPTSPGSSSKNN